MHRMNRTPNSKSAITLIHQLIEEQALNNPNAIAVTYSGNSLSYSELNERANQLAHYLHINGIKTDTLVGICIERSLETIIGILAILKAGCVYVPLDPDYPEERINFMLSDSNISFLITKQKLIKKFHKTENINLIFLDQHINEIQKHSKTNPKNYGNSDNLAYVLYTSGSTGNPKGVMVSHNNLIHAYSGWEKIYELKNTDSHLQMANFSFDVFSGDFIRALCSGGKLVLCPKEILLIPEKLHALMKAEKINCAEFVPTVLRRLVEFIEKNNYSLNFMRLLICGSDNWSINEYRKLQKICDKNARVINSYGLTEATIDSTYFEDNLISEEHFAIDHSVPIGKPFPKTEIFLLDENLNKVPSGETGEIYIGGPGLAKGYLNRPDLTCQKFIPHPFSNTPEERLYKTGDLGRLLSDGNIEFLGRIDNQIKLRGMRIELNDIENVLNCYPIIRESIVSVFEDEFKHKKLIAHIVVEQGCGLDVINLRNFLQNRLPSYMIPAHFIKLDTLPLTPNGKLDRQGLKFTALLLPEDKFIAPSNQVEKKLATIWQKLLNVKRVGILDSFTDLGGDSFLAAQLIIEIESAFCVKLNLCEIANKLTITELSKSINNALCIGTLKEEIELAL